MTAVIALLGGIRATVFAGIALLALMATGVQTWRLDSAQAAIADMSLQVVKEKAALAAAQVEASEAARQQEQDRARAANEVAAAYEKGKDDAKAAGDLVAADLRAGVSRLQDRWRGCEARRVPGTADTSSQPDASAIDRNESAGRIVGAAEQCDAQVIGLQQFILSERQ